MKKAVLSMLLALLLVIGVVSVQGSANASSKIKVIINGANISFHDQDPIIVEGRTLVPLRVIAEHFAVEVGWEPQERAVNLQWENEETKNDYKFTIGSRQYKFSKKYKMVANRDISTSAFLDVPPFIINDRTMVPIRFISEILDKKVEWDESTSTVEVSDKPSKEEDVNKPFIYDGPKP